jgi:hypothetical protein
MTIQSTLMKENSFYTLIQFISPRFSRMVMRFSLLFSAVMITSSLLAQQPKVKKDRFPSYFGLAVSPIFPNNFVGSKTATFKDSTSTMTTTFNQKTGIMFGASVRIGITKLISIETGIYQIRRNFDVSMSVPDSNVYGNKTLGFVNYDIPINALVYVQLAEQWYMNASLGFSINQYPTDVRDSILPGGKNYLEMQGRRVERTHFSSNAGIGFEYRTKKAGTFYLGAAGKITFRPIMLGVGIMHQTGTSNRLVSVGRINGGYFSIDFRYYLPTLRMKGPQFQKGPIEQ